MAIDPVSAALDAIAAHFAAAGISGLTARRGWPEANVELDLGAGPLLTVAATDRGRVVFVTPVRVDSADDLHTYKVGELEVAATLDLWCAYRATRDDAAALVDAALHNGLPFWSGLRVTSSGYFSRPVNVWAQRISLPDETDGAARGEWRASWALVVTSDLVAQATIPRLARIALRVSTDLSGVELTEPDVDIT